VWLAPEVTGLFEAPVKVVFEEPGNWPGSRYLNHRVQRREVVFGVEVMSGCGETWAELDSEWRKAWAFDKDSTLYVTTEDSGTRYLRLRLLESPDVSWQYDPMMNTINKVVMTCVAADPFWWEDDVIVSAVTQTDTSFDPAGYPWPWPYDTLPKETLTMDVRHTNPTDQPIWPKWSLPGSEDPPAEPYIPKVPWLGAPKSRAVVWTVPDYSFTDPDKANRRLRLPGLIGGLRTEAVWRVIPAADYTITVDGKTTPTLPVASTPTQVQTAMGTLLGATNVSVTADEKIRETQIVEVLGGATGGTFTLTLDGQTTGPIRYNATPVEVQVAINQLPNVGFRGCFVRADSYNATQRVTLTGSPTGTYRLQLDGHDTVDIPVNALPIQVGVALKALPNVGIFDALVTGPVFGGGPYDINFGGNLGGVKVNLLTADMTNLTGGAVAVTRPSEGGTRYAVTFDRQLLGVNMPLMVGSPGGLTGGVNPRVSVITQVHGQSPLLVRFTGTMSGKDVQLTTSAGAAATVHVKGGTAKPEDAYVDTDPRTEQITSASGSQLWSRMNGVRFVNPIPAYTGAKTFEVTVSGAKPGQMITLRLPRPWSRPWGLE